MWNHLKDFFDFKRTRTPREAFVFFVFYACVFAIMSLAFEA
jgi:hypothetical protein